MKVALLIGSGVSKGCGLPDVNDITNSIFDDKWQSQIHSLPSIESLETSSQVGVSSEEQKKETLKRIQCFLRAINTIVNNISTKYNEAPINYEHLDEITSHLRHRNYYSQRNPISIFLYEYLMDSLQEHLTPLPIKPNENTTLDYIAFLARKLIKDIMIIELKTKEIKADFAKLGVIRELSISPFVDRLDIFTTNHDRLIEKLLSNNNVEFSDGFDKPIDEIPRLNYIDFDSDSKVKLYKLHGSIDWYDFLSREPNISFLGLTDDISDYKKWDGNIISPMNSEPYCLTGIINKTLDYESWPYEDIIFRFQNSLEDHDVLIESGYGWKDESLNVKLHRWFSSNANKKIICLHQNPKIEIKENRVSFMAQYYDQLVDSGRVIIPFKEGTKEGKWLSECSCEELLSYCNC